MNKKTSFYKGSILHFKQGSNENLEQNIEFIVDGLMVVEDGHIVEVGEYELLNSKYSITDLQDYSGKILCPGFIDTHVHYPQILKTASHGNQLLEWLENDIFPEEKKFSDYNHAQKVADIFLTNLLKNGTTTALVFATVHKNSVEAFFDESKKRNLRMISGKVLMDRNAPEYLTDTAESAYADSKELIQKWHKKDRLLYALTPRFAPTCSDEQLKVVKKLQDEFEDVYIHTHLAENHDEIKWVKELYPDSKNYLDVYDQFGLVGKRSVFAHCLHLDDTEFELFAEKEAAMSFCPSSNAFLGSGFFKFHKALKHQVKLGLGTDLGAGTRFSMLETMKDAYQLIQLQKSLPESSEVKTLQPFEAFYLATLGGAKALCLEDKIGNFEKGKEADFIVLNYRQDEFLKHRCANLDIKKLKDLKELLFVLMILGSREQVESTYIMGEKVN